MNQIDYLSQLPIDIFIHNITYLPFSDVINICSTNQKLHTYCTDPQYNNHWKSLIDNTFSLVDNYEEKLNKIWLNLKVIKNTYNYQVYTGLIKLLDPITQAMIYYRQLQTRRYEIF
uniref:F-box-like family protein n=1 Tax=Pithovirus LCPAC302 TaxID=2506593 RepID=A0A481Z8D0_9VIRU|nr:MAG: F-box-like family protein [Pithovirus LCPAC302]